MSDLVSLVLGIPGIIEGFVKTCRALEAYNTADRKHLEVIADAVHCSRKIGYYAHFVDCSSFKGETEPAVLKQTNMEVLLMSDVVTGDREAILRDSKQLLFELFRNCILSLNTAREVVNEWTIRLKLNVENRGHGRFIIARLALAISDFTNRAICSSLRNRDRSTLSSFYDKTAFLVIGSQKIEDAMNRLKHWLRELHDILMVSPAIRYDVSASEVKQIDPVEARHDDVLFIAMAREREGRLGSMEMVKSESIAPRRPLDGRKPYSLTLVDSKDSPYHGCLVDRRNIVHLLQKGKEDQALRDTELIARLFAAERDYHGQEITASVGLLTCCGFSRPTRQFHDLIFRLPEDSRRPRTLRSLLLDGRPQHALDDRLQFCIKLATALLIVHSLRIVHKDIRPDSIIVLDKVSTLNDAPGGSTRLGEPFLVSFNVSRSVDSGTVPLTEYQDEEVRWASLYTHPRHLAGSRHRPFEMRDDIYSLGICLLEIAMWSSLFKWDDKLKAYVNDTSICDLSEERYSKMLEDLGEDVNSGRSWLRHRDLVILAEQRIPITMGNVFKDVVVECLTFGMGKKSLAEVLEEKDLARSHIQNQSIAFIRNILSKLRSLKLS